MEALQQLIWTFFGKILCITQFWKYSFCILFRIVYKGKNLQGLLASGLYTTQYNTVNDAFHNSSEFWDEFFCVSLIHLFTNLCKLPSSDYFDVHIDQFIFSTHGHSRFCKLIRWPCCVPWRQASSGYLCCAWNWALLKMFEGHPIFKSTQVK